MIGLEDRQVLARNIEQAHQAGARLRLACEIAGINVRTLQRWKAGEGLLCGDNGATLKAATVLAMLHWLGVKPSYSRPRVSDDNAFAESLFRTAKYRPEFPTAGFADLDSARQWAASFVRWYNHDHRHGGMRVPITRSCSSVMRCIARPANAIRAAGPARRAIGRLSAPSRSIQNVMPSSTRIWRASINSQWLHESGDNYLDTRRLLAGEKNCYAASPISLAGIRLRQAEPGSRFYRHIRKQLWLFEVAEMAGQKSMDFFVRFAISSNPHTMVSAPVFVTCAAMHGAKPLKDIDLQQAPINETGIMDGSVAEATRFLRELIEMTGQTADAIPVLELQLGDILTRTTVQAGDGNHLLITAVLPRSGFSGAIAQTDQAADIEYLWHADEGCYIGVRRIPLADLPDERSVMDVILSTSDHAAAWFSSRCGKSS